MTPVRGKTKAAATNMTVPSFSIPGYFWLAVIVAVAVYELWAVITGNHTLSQWVWLQEGNYPWFKWVVAGGLAGLMIHLVTGK